MSEFISARDLRQGQTIVWKDCLYLVLDHSFNKTAMRGGIVKCKVKNLSNNAITVEDFSNQKFEKAVVENLSVIFSHADDKFLYFLDSESFNEHKVEKQKFDSLISYLEAGCDLSLNIYNSEVINIILPDLVSLTIENLEDSSNSSEQKKAITVSGLSLFVPKFCNVGDKIFVSSSNGKYKSR